MRVRIPRALPLQADTQDMRSFPRAVLGSLLGISLALAGSTQAKAAGDNCLLIICVDAPIVGPIVGGVGDVVEGILTPSNPAPPVPPVQPPVQPPVVPPVQPPTQPTQPQTPTSPSTGSDPVVPSDSGNKTDPTSPAEESPSTEVILPSPRPTVTVTPTPEEAEERPALIPEHEQAPLTHVSALTPYIVGILGAMLVVLVGTSLVRFLRSRKKLPWWQDTSALPWDLKSRK